MLSKVAAHPNGDNTDKEFHEIVNEHYEDLKRYCHSIAGASWEAEDLIQDTLLKAFTALRKNPGHANPKAFLFRIASNTWIDRHRKQKWNLYYEMDINRMTHKKQIDSADIRGAVETLVTNLSAKQCAAILLTEVFEFTSSEAAEVIGCTEGAVKSALHRGREKLKSLKEEEPIERTDESYEEIIDACIEAIRRVEPAKIAVLLNPRPVFSHRSFMLMCAA